MQVENYYIQRNIPKWGKDSYVNWTKNSERKAIVFIHGFSGSSMTTFGDFNLEFRLRKEYIGYDVFFYGYDSLFKQIAPSALSFLNFLRAIHNNIDLVIKNSGIKIQREQYCKIVIVAHSLGAVITRMALNEGFKTEGQWLGKCELILFAPAHKGAREEILGFLDMPGLPKFLGPLSKYFVVTLKQLMDASKLIKPMEDKVRKLIEQQVRSFTIPKRIIWAEKERVVINDFFLEDPEPIEVEGKRHEDVCKPDQVNEAYNYVAEFL